MPIETIEPATEYPRNQMPQRKPKTKVVTDDFSTPIFDQRFIFEMTINFETVAKNGKGGYVIPRKTTHPAIESLMPKADEQIGIAHGAALAAWCATPTGTPGLQAPAGATGAPSVVSEGPKSSANDRKAIADAKKRLWELTREIHKENPGALQQWLWDEGLMLDTSKLADLDLSGLVRLIHSVEKKLNVPVENDFTH